MKELRNELWKKEKINSQEVKVKKSAVKQFVQTSPGLDACLSWSRPVPDGSKMPLKSSHVKQIEEGLSSL